MTDAQRMKARRSLKVRLKRYIPIYILMIIPIVCIFVYRYYPIVLQIVLSFKKYKIKGGVWGSPWVGWENFIKLFTSPSISRIIVNTIRISVLRMVIGFFPPIILSILLFDMTSNKFRRIAQSILYIPHFFSWVVLYGIVMAIFQTDGYINNIRVAMGFQRVEFLMLQSSFLPLLIGSGLWKGLGWGTIIYMAALTGINPELYEVAKIDGAGPLRRIWYVTIPGIKSVVVFVLIMDLGKILSSAGTEQILLFYGPANYAISDVIGTWVYRQGLGKMEYGLSAALGMFESTVGLILVLFCNKVADKLAGVAIW